MPSPLKSDYCKEKKGRGIFFSGGGFFVLFHFVLFHFVFSPKEPGSMQNISISENSKFHKNRKKPLSHMFDKSF